MKKIYYEIIISCLLSTMSISLFAQTEVTRYTPKGSPVRAYTNIPELSSVEKNDYTYYVSTFYPDATQLNTPSATNSYNCHAYAWHMTEGGDVVWIGWEFWQDEDEDIYWLDGSYIELCSETGAEKISYYISNHSAVQTSTQGTYISKWGAGPLMEHSRDYGPYNMTYRKYYIKAVPPSLSGPSTLCSNGGTYSISHVPCDATITWSCSSNITRQSDQGSNPCTFVANTNGTGTISATITFLGNTYAVQKGGISVGLTASMSGPTQVSAGSSGTWTANASCGFTPYQYAWYLKKQGTLGSPSLVGNGSSLTLWAIPANPRDGGYLWEDEGDTTRGGINKVYYNLYVTVRDSHGAEYTPATKTVSVPKNYILSLGYERDDDEDTSDDCLENTGPTLTLSPNPAGEYVDIRIDFGNADNEPSNYVMDILNTSSYPVRNAVLSGGYNRVNVQGLQKGYYVVRIRYGDTVLTKPLMVD